VESSAAESTKKLPDRFTTRPAELKGRGDAWLPPNTEPATQPPWHTMWSHRTETPVFGESASKEKSRCRSDASRRSLQMPDWYVWALAQYWLRVQPPLSAPSPVSLKSLPLLWSRFNASSPPAETTNGDTNAGVDVSQPPVSPLEAKYKPRRLFWKWEIRWRLH